MSSLVKLFINVAVLSVSSTCTILKVHLMSTWIHVNDLLQDHIQDNKLYV